MRLALELHWLAQYTALYCLYFSAAYPCWALIYCTILSLNLAWSYCLLPLAPTLCIMDIKNTTILSNQLYCLVLASHWCLAGWYLENGSYCYYSQQLFLLLLHISITTIVAECTTMHMQMIVTTKVLATTSTPTILLLSVPVNSCLLFQWNKYLKCLYGPVLSEGIWHRSILFVL